MKYPKVLMVGPGPFARGGINRVIECYQQTQLWDEFCCKWIVTFNDVPNFRKLLIAIKAIFLYTIISHRYDISHIHFTGGASAWRKLPFYLIGRLFGHKIIGHIHLPQDPADYKGINYAFLYLIRKCDVIICLSRGWAEKFSALYPRVYECVPNPSVGYSIALPKQKMILFSGKLEARKGYADLIHAFSQLPASLGYKLYLAGHGELDQASETVRQLGLNNVVITGWLDREGMNDLYAQAEIFVLPSYAEGLPMALLEALAAGCAVLCTDVGAIGEHIEHGVNGLLISPGDVPAIYEFLNILTSDKKLVAELSRNGFEYFSKNFDSHNISFRIGQIYRNI
jgi:glycosyltransferase involved in cell wall biosynthesis